MEMPGAHDLRLRSLEAWEELELRMGNLRPELPTSGSKIKSLAPSPCEQGCSCLGAEWLQVVQV